MKQLLSSLLAFSFVFFVACQKPATTTAVQSKPVEKTLKPLGFKSVVETPLETVLAEAKAKNKLVFVDCYAVWCGPCKYMDENVFNQPDVVKKFTKNFVNLKVDVESFDGVNVSINYKVSSFPTYLFLNGEGEVVHRLEGLFTTQGLINEADFALTLQN